MTFWYMWNPPVNARQEKNSGSIKIWFNPSLHRDFFTFLYHLSPALLKTFIHGTFRDGDRLFATYHHIYHLSPCLINQWSIRKKNESLYDTLVSAAWNFSFSKEYNVFPARELLFPLWGNYGFSTGKLQFPIGEQIVSTHETKSTVPGNYFYDRLITNLHPGKETSRQRRTVNVTGIPVSSSVKVLLIRLENILNSAV